MHEIEAQLHQLPIPPPPLQAHSQSLEQLIVDDIKRSPNHSISFRRFMEHALYAPNLGYYSGALQTFGHGGDFTTAPEISPLFSHVIAKQCAEVLEQVFNGCVLEFGAGSGVMAAEILLELERIDCLPQTYFILDLSAGLKERQRQTISEKAPHLIDHVQWLSTLPDNFRGVMLGNEVLDSMPVERFKLIDNNVHQNIVRYDGTRFVDDFIFADVAFTKTVNTLPNRSQFTDGYLSEFNPHLDSWFKLISHSLERGAILLIDYGYHGDEYYREERTMGTLICHYQHRVFNDPYTYPGLCDITANVDFSAVTHHAKQAGFDLLGYTSQAVFLMHGGLPELLEQLPTADTMQRLKQAQRVKTLTSPNEMGERFKVIGLAKKLEKNLSGLAGRTLNHQL